MSNGETAMAFLKRFCAGDIDGLVALLADGLRFRSPPLQFGTTLGPSSAQQESMFKTAPSHRH